MTVRQNPKFHIDHPCPNKLNLDFIGAVVHLLLGIKMYSCKTLKREK
jgi:hypothetical protein